MVVVVVGLQDVGGSVDADQGIFESFGDAGEHLVAVPSHQHVIFDPDASPSWQIDTWFDCDHHAGFQESFGDRAESRFFMDIESDAVSESVAEELVVAGIFDDTPSGPVDGLERRAGPDRLDALPLGIQHHSMNFLKFRRCLSGNEDPGEVTPIATGGPGSPVEEDKAGVADPGGSGSSVRECGSGPHGHDRFERRPFGSESPHQVFEFVSHLEFGLVGFEHGGHGGEAAFGLANRQPDFGNFPGILDRSQLVDHGIE